jgi:hypothetical protein
VRAIIGVDGPNGAEEVVLGVDTHFDLNVAVAPDRLGRLLGELEVPTTRRGTKGCCVGRRASAPCGAQA